jgi:tetratricopeptide (TPR) repeat protein
VYLLREEHGPAEKYAKLVLADPPPVKGVRAGALEEAHSRLGMTALHRGDLDAAEEHFGAIVASIESELGPEHPALAQPLSMYGSVLLQRGNGEGAVAKTERARDVALATVGWEHPMLGYILNALALAESSRGNYEAAEKIAREVREHAALSQDPDAREVVDAEIAHADLLVELKRYDEARPLLRKATRHYGDEIDAALEHAAGRLALADGDLPEAQRRLMRALEPLDPAAPLPTDRGARGRVVWELARVRLAAGDRDDAEALARHAAALMASGNPWQQARVDEVEAWRASIRT